MLAAFDRWLRREPPEQKAQTGPGWMSYLTLPQISSIADSPVSRIAEAQALFRANPWVAQAERAIVGRYVSAGYHLEDSQGNTVGDTGPARAVKDFLDTPSQENGKKVSRRALWRLTLRHEGLAGNGFWYLDQRLPGGGAPLSVLYINPARMTPVENEAGRLIGWVMDHPQNPISQRHNLRNAVPFELTELRHFVLDEPDWGHYGIGIAEAAYTEIQLNQLAVKHVASVFAAGGRLAGLISPKQGATVSDEQWAQFIKDWRSIASDPDSAKRLLIARGPIDLHDTAANLSELQMADLLTLSRDDIFVAWGLPASQAPIQTPAGLNGGERTKFDEAALWQGAIDYRAAPFEEQVQSIIDLFGLGLRLVVEKPAFDDQAPLFENAEKASKQPLTNNERRALLGFDPLDDEELGAAIFIDKAMVPLSMEPPAPAPNPFAPAPPSGQDATPEPSGLGEAAQPVKADLREQWAGRIQQAVQAFLSEQATAISNRVRNNHAHIVRKPVDTDSWWSARQWDRRLAEILDPILTELATATSRTAGASLGKAKSDWLDRVLEQVRRLTGLRISGINQTTRDSIARLVAQGVEAGLGPSELAQTIREATAFNDARAEMIARTEAGTVYNHAAVQTYRQLDVAKVNVIDGDHDEACANANGATWTLDEAEADPLGHPNCVRDFVPVT